MSTIQHPLMAAALAACLLATPAAADDGLVTGTTTFDIRLGNAATASGIAELSGELVATLLRTCSAYRSELDVEADVVAIDGTKIKQTMEADYVEEATKLVFDSRATFAGILTERSSGTAIRTASGVTVSLTEPGTKTVDLAGPILFPMGMIEAALAEARAGGSLIDLQVYDGSGNGETVWSVSITIGRMSTDPVTVEEADFVDALGFTNRPHWPMTFSYFPPNAGGEPTPAFVSKAIVYDNGFLLSAGYDFGVFGMDLELTGFKPIEPEPCP